MPRHVHDSAYPCLVLSGSYCEKIEGWSSGVGAGSIYFMPAEQPPSTSFHDDGAFVFRVELQPSALAWLGEHRAATNSPWVRAGGEHAWMAARLYASFRRGSLDRTAVEQSLLNLGSSGKRVGKNSAFRGVFGRF